MSTQQEDRTKAAGYRNPPKEHQFKPGQSGNSKGRPKKKKAEAPVSSKLADHLEELFRDELARPIVVRDGDDVLEITRERAIVRQVVLKATNGDMKAASLVLSYAKRAHANEANFNRETFQRTLEHLQTWEPIFARHEREGLPPPEVYPNPDDIILDPVTHAVEIDGPKSAQEAAEDAVRLAEALEKAPRLREVKACLAKDPKNMKLKKEFEALQEYALLIAKTIEREKRHEQKRASREEYNKQQELERTNA